MKTTLNNEYLRVEYDKDKGRLTYEGLGKDNRRAVLDLNDKTKVKKRVISKIWKDIRNSFTLLTTYNDIQKIIESRIGTVKFELKEI